MCQASAPRFLQVDAAGLLGALSKALVPPTLEAYVTHRRLEDSVQKWPHSVSHSHKKAMCLNKRSNTSKQSKTCAWYEWHHMSFLPIYTSHITFMTGIELDGQLDGVSLWVCCTFQKESLTYRSNPVTFSKAMLKASCSWAERVKVAKVASSSPRPEIVFCKGVQTIESTMLSHRTLSSSLPL